MPISSPAQPGQPAPVDDGGVAGVDLLVEVVEHLVAVVGAQAHGQADFPRAHGQHQLAHRGVYIHVAFEVVGYQSIPRQPK